MDNQRGKITIQEAQTVIQHAGITLYY